MAHINLSVKHGQAPDVARAIFEDEIGGASAKHADWIQRVEWSTDRTTAMLFGPGIEVQLSCDAQEIHATGKVPFYVKLLEIPLKAYVQQAFRKHSPQ